MKYEDSIVEDSNEAHNIILKQISPGSRVLEFGSASGRMTKLLKEKLHCRVFIVEYEKAAYKKAITYADDGVCGDIESLKWKKKWKNIKFDYILFADVLEHLKRPYDVLCATEDILSTNGTVLISIPNIAHNDIFLKLYNNHFDYTEIGILDNTHLHFWAEENLKDFEDNTGYQICNVKYKTVPTWTTEQFRNTAEVLTSEMQTLLPRRQNGEVYQFILNLRKKEYVKENSIRSISDKTVTGYILGRLYYDRGNGFLQEDSTTVIAVLNDTGNYEVHIRECLDTEIVNVRYDPLEGQSCVIYDLKVLLDGIERKESYQSFSNSFTSKNEIFLGSSDPQIVFENVGGKLFELTLTFAIEKECVERLLEKRIEELIEENKKIKCGLNKFRGKHINLKRKRSDVINKHKKRYSRLTVDARRN